MLEVSQASWKKGDTGKKIYNIMPSVSHPPNNWNREDVIFFSQHGPFPAYLKRFHLSDSDYCSCGGIGTALHYATECILTVSWHMRKPVPNFEQEWLKRVANNLDSRHKIRRIVKFISENILSGLPSLQLSSELNQQAPNYRTSPPPIQKRRDNGGTSLTLPSISEDDENNDSDGTTPASPMSPCLTINRNKYNAGDDNWESKVHQFRRTFQGHRPTVRFEKLRPAATHPNLQSSPPQWWMARFRHMDEFNSQGRSWDIFDIRDEIEVTKNSVERLDSQMTSLTQDVANLSQEVRTTLALLQQKYECSVTLPQTSQSCESLPIRKHATNPLLPRRASSQPLRLPSGDQTNQEELPTPSTVDTEAQTDFYLLDDILYKRSERCPPLQRNSGCCACSPSEEKVTFLVGHSTTTGSTGEDGNFKLDFATSQGTRSKETSPRESTRMATFWSSSNSDASVPSSRFRNSMNGSRESNARNDVPEEIVVDIDGSTSLRRKLSTEL
ncbi:hypothetical protein AVEN_195636-1 [Araneus ventricosus]|uniref:Uncharacterized protein n=1 Tax=Araneus ventricosus TaxID=182803 RepID=A0A4Y2B8V6_ARAVE|nr:hypothetical protein AVEN_195636-1 [Araneus ventricosus]